MDEIVIKKEFDENRPPQCRGCLSVGRKLIPIGRYLDLFNNLLFDHVYTHAISVNNKQLCWECYGQLRRIYIFRQQVIKANDILRNGQGYIGTLSNLITIIINDSNPRTIYVNDSNLQIIKNDDSNMETLRVDKNSHNDTNLKNNDDDCLSDDNHYNDNDVNSDKLVVDDKVKKETDNNDKENKKSKWAVQKALLNKKPKFKILNKNDLTVDKNFKRVQIDVEELKDFMERERDSDNYKNEKYKCHDCVEVFKNVVLLFKHNSIFHEKVLGTHKCDVCNSRLNEKDLPKHTVSHSCFQCVICKILCFKWMRRKHLIEEHAEVFQCLRCDLKFCNKKDFFSHYKDWHEKYICDHCGVSFKMRYCIKDHLRKQHSPFECKPCGKRFARYNGLWLHKKLRHSSPTPPAYCVECDKQYPDVYRYRWHLANSARHKPKKKVKIPCPSCEKVFSKKIYMTNHYDLVHLKQYRFRCEQCDKNFIRNADLVKHNRRVHEGILPPRNKICYVCGRGFTETRILLCWECTALLKKIQSFQNRIQHAQFILQQSLYELDNLPMTPLSTLSVTKKDGFHKTIDYDARPKTPDPETCILPEVIKQEVTDDDNDNIHFNDDSFSDNDILTIDLNKLKGINDQNHIKVEQGDTLNKQLIRKQSIRKYESKARITKLKVDLTDTRKHCTSVILTEKEIEEVLERDKVCYGYNKMPNKCRECKNAYKRVVDLRRHETFNHIKTIPSKCILCDIPISSWEGMSEHWRRHNAYLRCSMCGWLSHSLAAMTKHHRRVHSCVFRCTACDAACSTLREFSNHYKETHERIICDHCGKSFIKKKTLQVHIKRHHTPATCHECNRTYAHYHVLENHYRMHHPHLIRADTRTELAYCVECDKQFPSVYKYRRHLATAAKHTPPKPVRVPCPECGKVFARKIRMTNHYKSVHINTTKHRCDICNKTFCSAFSARTHRQHVHEKIPMPKNKMCDICGRGFSTNRILTNHRRTHTGERPYKCSYCPATFAQRTAMKTHEKTQHKHGDPS